VVSDRENLKYKEKELHRRHVSQYRCQSDCLGT